MVRVEAGRCGHVSKGLVCLESGVAEHKVTVTKQDGQKIQDITDYYGCAVSGAILEIHPMKHSPLAMQSSQTTAMSVWHGIAHAMPFVHCVVDRRILKYPIKA